MTIEFVDLRLGMTVGQAFDRIRKVGEDKETIYTCYVIDNQRYLEGVVTVKDLLLNDQDVLIDELMESSVVKINTLDDQEIVAQAFDKYDLEGVVTVKDLLLNDQDVLIDELMESSVVKINTLDDQEIVAQAFDKYDFLAMPVVDKENRLVGIITIDDALDVMAQETSEDFELMSAIQPSEESYLKMSAWEHSKHRIVWLLFLMLSATITGTIITKYENAFAAVPILVSFVPMLMDTGGNCGSQTSTLIIRGLATNDLQLSDVFKCWFKEIQVSLICGVILGIVNGIRIAIQYHNVVLAVVVAISLLATVIISKSLGCLLPMAAKKLNLDPAIMASPLITTIVDTCSILIYFNVAVVLMHI